MAGRRLLDVGSLLAASKNIAGRHIALRNRQLYVFLRTSSLAKAAKAQAERYTETAKAAATLAGRMNEDRPAWTYEATDTTPTPTSAAQPIKSSVTKDETTIPSKKAVEASPSISPAAAAMGINSEVYYNPGDRAVAEAPPKGELHVREVKADAYPTPDGSISPASKPAGVPLKAAHRHKDHDYRLSPTEARVLQRQSEQQIPSQAADGEEGHKDDEIVSKFDHDSFYHPSKHTSPVLSNLPRAKLPKHVADEQGDVEGVRDQEKELNSDTFTQAISIPGKGREFADGMRGTEHQKRKEEIDPLFEFENGREEVSIGINTAIFNSRKVARALGGKTNEVMGREPQTGGRKPHPLSPKATPSVAETQVEDVKFETPAIPAEQSQETVQDIAAKVEESDAAHTSTPIVEILKHAEEKKKYEMRESRVPSSRLGRIWNYGGLAAGMFGGAISESLRRATGSSGEGSFMLSAANMDRLVAKLSRMRGAALKMGQMMSFQDSKMLPPQIQEVLMRVQDCADYMPASQRNKVLAANLGADWRELFGEFEEKPIAAASIGQVHAATLKNTGERVAVKVQYPGVADSIDSDLNNLAILLTASKLLPKGLFLEKTIANARTELAWECDYVREKECGERFQQLLADEKDVFLVPRVIPECSGKTIITMEFMDGVGVTKVQNLTQEQRDWIGTNILRLCLREITEFRFMQTDPNWTNFLFNAQTQKLELLDFGASREYPQEFIAAYTQLLNAASKSDKEGVRELSLQLGYLTGQESQVMVDAHTSSVLTLAEPFLASSPEVYDFKDQTITERVKSLIPLMIKERLAPPPEETYSLHRKLSGAFLLCARLGSRVPCRKLFRDSMAKAGYA